VTEFPFAVDRATLQRGRERYEIFCSVCHGLAGYGDGMVVQRGFKRPPSFHDEATKAKTVGYYYDVIANGFGVMPSYRELVPTKDRWAIVAYLRALQLSQSASMSDVPEDKRAELQ
jgi:mono/diheme cytochrome c family protein